MIRRTLCAAATAACLIHPPPAVAQNARPTIVTVVKVTGLPWFKRMEEGVTAFAASNPGIQARQIGPARADPAEQQALLQSLVDQKVDALAVVPTDPGAIEGVTRLAMERGMVVVSHEADNLRNTQANIEAFDNTTFGAALNEHLARCMGHRGQWVSFVGSRGSRTHRLWAEGGALNARRHPRMVLVEPLTESNDDAELAYTRARSILQMYPNIKGFQGAASSDVIGIGRAVEEAGLQGKVCVVGTGLPSRTAHLLESGAVQGIGFWDPRNAALAMNRVAQLLLTRQAITDGMDLGVPGYRQVKVTKGLGGGWLIVGQADVIADKDSYRKHPF